MKYCEILDFWFNAGPSKWFVKDTHFDDKIRNKFYSVYKEGINGELDYWEKKADSSLALIILLDQFPRNMFRGSARMFEADSIALRVAKESIERGFDKEVKRGRTFFYMPFMHSENIAHQYRCIELFENTPGAEEGLEFAIKHKDIIEEFGRFPHRNKALGRETTPEEMNFLSKPGSSF